MAILKSPLYALEHPETGLYFRLDGALPRLTLRERACLAPATREGHAWIAERATCLRGIPYDLVRLDA